MTIPNAYTGNTMSRLVLNTGGNLQNLPDSRNIGGRVREASGALVFNTQAIGFGLSFARVPLGCRVVHIDAFTDTSLGTAQISVGNTNSNVAYGAARTLTALNTRANLADVSAALLSVVQVGFDSLTGLASTSYDDMILWTSVATLPASGNLILQVQYVLD